jgi:hypothetical protein
MLVSFSLFVFMGLFCFQATVSRSSFVDGTKRWSDQIDFVGQRNRRRHGERSSEADSANESKALICKVHEFETSVFFSI